MALPIAPILEFIEKYVFGDWEFVKFLIVLVVIDTVLGFIKNFMEHDIISREFTATQRP